MSIYDNWPKHKLLAEKKRLDKLLKEAKRKQRDNYDKMNEVIRMGLKGVYIVSKVVDTTVELTSFDWLVKGTEVPVKQINLQNFTINSHMLSEDGKPMDWKPGALLMVEQQGPKAFRMANVGPENEATEQQYMYALIKIGVSEAAAMALINKEFLKVDGQFRKLSIENVRKN